MTDYTPTTDEVRDLFVYGAWERARNGCDDEANEAEFDWWLAARDREVAAKALRDAANGIRTAPTGFVAALALHICADRIGEAK